jgi:glyoxylase-like metal-dependent hydrolase (beta-lactamase superfamily II)
MPRLWEIYAIRYAHHARLARENFIGGDPHEDSPMPLDYFVWALRSSYDCYVIDTGFGEAQAKLRKRTLLKSPAEGLRAIGIEPNNVRRAITTHLHYDHCGNYDLLPQATYVLQEREMQYATGRLMRHDFFRHAFDEEGVVAMVRNVYAQRVQWVNGDEEIDDGISVHLAGGHSQGLQAVRVQTRRGAVVVASDTAHLYEHLRRNLAFTVTGSIADTLESYAKLRKLASPANDAEDDHIIPGHDPEVMRRYPAAAPELEGWVARLD